MRLAKLLRLDKVLQKQILGNCCFKKVEKLLGLNILKELIAEFFTIANFKMKLYVQVNLHIKLNPMFIRMKFKKQRWSKKEITARKIIK